MAEFVRRVGAPVHARRSRRLPALAGRTWAGRAAAAAAVAALAVSGMATASYAGVLPAPVQRLAHELIGAPAAHTGGGHHHAAPRHAPVRSAAPARLRCSWHASAMRDGGRHDTAPSCRDSRRNPAKHRRSPECRPAPQQSGPPGSHRSWPARPHRSWPQDPHRSWPQGQRRPWPQGARPPHHTCGALPVGCCRWASRGPAGGEGRAPRGEGPHRRNAAEAGGVTAHRSGSPTARPPAAREGRHRSAGKAADEG